jgi:SAM-dependent methyltransferase
MEQNLPDGQNLPDRFDILQLMRDYQPACVLGAAAELNLFTLLGDRSRTATELAEEAAADPRAMAVLLDALTALRLLEKTGHRYATPAPLRPLLAEHGPQTVLPMIWHSMNCLRQWTRLAWVVKRGVPDARQASLRGEEADRAAFIAAMHSVSGPMADPLVAFLGDLPFRHLLDVGGASGTWTLAFLRARPGTTATIFDLPDAIDQARRRLAGTAMAGRVMLVPGDFYADDLPPGADLAWLSAIVHQHSREHNRALYRKVHRALQPGGRIAVRDIVMASDRTRPPEGAMFAVNMLVNTETGGTFTLAEFAEDLEAAGFVEPVLLLDGEAAMGVAMNSVLAARKA